MKFIKKRVFLDNGVYTKKYYFLGIRYLKKIWADSFKETYIFKKKVSGHYTQHTLITNNQTHLSDLIKYVDTQQKTKFHS